MGAGNSRDQSEAIQRDFLIKAKEEFEARWANTQSCNATGSEFEFKRTLGEGSFGRVMLARKKDNPPDKQYYAIKILDKERIAKMKQVDHTLNEKRILHSIRFPLVVYMEYSWKDNSNLYIGLEFVNGGEMFTNLRNAGRYSEHTTRFYASCVLLAFEYLHHLNIVYRDLKPENLLIDPVGYVKVTDFGFAKCITGRTYTLCGTPDYLPPEIILNKGYNKSVDWWSFGVLIYEMCAGYPPFLAKTDMQIYEKICTGKVKYPSGFSPEMKDVCKNLMQIDLSRRYGNLKGGVHDIKNSPFFKDMDWVGMYQKRLQAPFVPTHKGPGDCSHFEQYQEKRIRVSAHCKYEKEFHDF